MACTLTLRLLAWLVSVLWMVGNSSAVKYRVTTIIEHPFTMVSNSPDGGTTYKGYLIDVLQDLKTSLGVDFDIDLVADGTYGTVTEEGNWTGLIGHLVREEADIAAAALTVVAKRAKTVDFTQPYMLAGPQILMKTPQGLTMSKFFMLLQPLSTGVWITALVGYVVVSLALYAIWRWSPFEWGNAPTGTDRVVRESFNIHNSFLFAFSTMLWQGYSLAPRSLSGRILSAIWWIFTMFFLVAYTASLTGRFIIKDSLTPTRINTFDDLALSNLRYGAIKGGSTAYLFKTAKNPLRQRMWRQMQANPSDMVSSTAEGIKKVRESNGNYAFIMETPTAEYQASLEPCDLYVTGEPLTDNGYAFACKKGSGVCDQLSHGLLKIKETARLHDLRRKWFGGVCAVKNEQKTKSEFASSKTTFTLEDAAFAFLLLGVGLIISLTAFGLEIFLNGKGIVMLLILLYQQLLVLYKKVPSSGKDDEIRIHDPASGM